MLRIACAVICFITFSQFSPVASTGKFNQHISPLQKENGIVRLIIKAYTDSVLRELQSGSRSRMSRNQVLLLRQRMSDLYDHIRHHPALYQRYLWVGKGKPHVDPDDQIVHDQEVKFVSRDVESYGPSAKRNGIQKRSHASSMFPPEEICKTNRQWEQINRTHDFYDHEVEVVQEEIVQQFVFSYRCVANGGPCLGISPLYESECTERYGWMYMYYRRIDRPKSNPQWGYVAAPHHCACKITPKFVPEV